MELAITRAFPSSTASASAKSEGLTGRNGRDGSSFARVLGQASSPNEGASPKRSGAEAAVIGVFGQSSGNPEGSIQSVNTGTIGQDGAQVASNEAEMNGAAPFQLPASVPDVLMTETAVANEAWAAEGNAVPAIPGQEASGETPAGPPEQADEASALKNVNDMIELLLDRLEQAGYPDGEAETTFESAAEQLDALLALLGYPSMPLQLQPDSASNVQPVGGAASAGGSAAAAVKESLQNALFQLQSALRDGSESRLVQHRSPVDLASGQLKIMLQQLEEAGGSPAAAAQPQAAAPESSSLVPAVSGSDSAAQLLKRLESRSQAPTIAALLAQRAEPKEGDADPQLTAAALSTGGMQAVTASDANPAGGGAVQTEASSSQVTMQQFNEKMTGLILQKFDVSTVSGVSEARLTLAPEHLGEVNVKLSIHNGQLTALFVTDTLSAKEALEQQLVQLRNALQSQGLEVDRLDVTQGQLQAQLSFGQQGRGSGGQQSGRGDAGRRGENDATVEAPMVEEAVRRAAGGDLGFGRSINVKA